MLVTLFGMLLLPALSSRSFSSDDCRYRCGRWFDLVEPYRIRRVTPLDLEDPFGSGYQLTQSLMFIVECLVKVR